MIVYDQITASFTIHASLRLSQTDTANIQRDMEAWIMNVIIRIWRIGEQVNQYINGNKPEG